MEFKEVVMGHIGSGSTHLPSSAFFFKGFSLFDTESKRSRAREHKQGGWQAEAEGETNSLLSKDPDHDMTRRQMLNQESHLDTPHMYVLTIYFLFSSP